MNRFLLGALEAMFNPGFVLLMSMWHTSTSPLWKSTSAFFSTRIPLPSNVLLGTKIQTLCNSNVSLPHPIPRDANRQGAKNHHFQTYQAIQTA